MLHFYAQNNANLHKSFSFLDLSLDLIFYLGKDNSYFIFIQNFTFIKDEDYLQMFWISLLKGRAQCYASLHIDFFEYL